MFAILINLIKKGSGGINVKNLLVFEQNWFQHLLIKMKLSDKVSDRQTHPQIILNTFSFYEKSVYKLFLIIENSMRLDDNHFLLLPYGFQAMKYNKNQSSPLDKNIITQINLTEQTLYVFIHLYASIKSLCLPSDFPQTNR